MTQTREERIARNREYNRIHREEKLAYSQKYNREHREEKRLKNAAYNAANKLKKQEYSQWYEANKREDRTEYKHEYNKMYQDINYEKLRIRRLEWEAENKEKLLLYQEEYRQEHLDKASRHQHLYNLALREYIFMVYSTNGEIKCACCGERERDFLAIDHIDGRPYTVDGKRIARTGTACYHELHKQGFPPGLQILCHNCNLAKGFYGVCPHLRKIKKIGKGDCSPIPLGISVSKPEV